MERTKTTMNPVVLERKEIMVFDRQIGRKEGRKGYVYRNMDVYICVHTHLTMIVIPNT